MVYPQDITVRIVMRITIPIVRMHTMTI